MTYYVSSGTLNPTQSLIPYWSNAPFLMSDIRALWRSVLSARMSDIKNGALDQYGVEPFEQRQFGTAGVEGVNKAGFSADPSGVWRRRAQGTTVPFFNQLTKCRRLLV